MADQTLESRRYHLSEFREIFTALFKIEDRQVQSRVLNAINGIVHGECECRQNRKFLEVSVQTSEESFAKESIKKSTASKSVQTNKIEPEPNAIIPRVLSRSVQTNFDKCREPTISRTRIPQFNPSESPLQILNSSTAQNQNSSPPTYIETDPDETETVEVISEVVLSPEETVVECESVEETAKEAIGKVGISHSEPTYSSITIELITDKDSSQDSTAITSITSEFDEESTGASEKRSLSLSQIKMTLNENQRIIRKRKRKSKVPRVEKAESEPTPYQEILKEKMTCRPKKIARTDITPQRTGEQIGSLLNYFPPDVIDKEMNEMNSSVIELMKQEFLRSGTMENGYHAIHTAILENNLGSLKRQIYILKYLKRDINEILTDNQESPLQLAVMNNCILPIMKELIAVGTNVSELDCDNNTLLHLAMLHSESVALLKLILSRFDYKLINAQNYNGQTALHIGAVHEKLHMCRVLLEFIDQKENLTTIGKSIDNKELLLQCYKKELNRLRSRPQIKINNVKYGIMNARDPRHGRTPLFLALGNNSADAELMVLMFLVNFADPRVADHNGMDCVQFAAETITDSKSSRYTDALECCVAFFENQDLSKRIKS